MLETMKNKKQSSVSESVSEAYSRLMPLKEGAEWLGISPDTLRQKAQKGEVETHKLWGRRLISEDEVIRLMEAARVPARAEAA